jgi:hypothetical protein
VAEPTAEPEAEPVSAGDVLGQLAKRVGRDHPGLVGLLVQARLKLAADAATLHFPADAASAAGILERGDKLQIAADALAAVTGRRRPIRVEIAPAPPTAAVGQEAAPGVGPPAPPPEPTVGRGPHEVKDELVKAIIEELGGQVVKVE